MSDPISFDSASPRFGLPLLFAGQAQKEVFINEAHALTDALLHCAIEGVAGSPPGSPAEGTNWLVAPSATGDWLGKDGSVACRQAGNWIYVTPRDGMRLMNRNTGQDLRFAGAWHFPATPAAPTGGTVVDDLARGVIVSIINALRVAGIFATG